MAERLEIIASLTALLLGAVLFAYLSESAAGLVLRCWVLFGPLCLMAFLERERRGVTRRGGGLPLSRLLALAARAAAIGLFFAALVAAFAASWLGAAP